MFFQRFIRFKYHFNLNYKFKLNHFKYPTISLLPLSLSFVAFKLNSDSFQNINTLQNNEIINIKNEPIKTKTIENKEIITNDHSNWKLLKSVLKHITPDWLLVLAIVIITGCAAGINIYTPIVIGQLVSTVQDSLKNATNVNLIEKPAIMLLSLFASQGLLTFIDIALVSQLGENVAQRIRNELFEKIISQDMTFFDERMQGEIVGRLTQDVSEFKHTFKLVITQGLKCTSQIVGSVISLFTLSPSLTFTLASSMPVLYIFMNFYGIFLRQLSKKAREIDSDASSVASEAISNIRTVRAFVAEDSELQRYTNAADKSGKLNTHLGFHIGLFQGLTNTSIGCMILVILYSGGRLVMEGKMTGGQLMAFMVSTQNTQKSMALVGVLFGQVIKAMGTASRVFEYIHLQPTIPTRGGIIPSTFKGMVEFQNVSFKYPSRPDHTILHNFSLTVPAGTMVALCGQSGSGKSTVGQLLERFYDIDHGRILIDGVNIQEIDPSWLRSHIGYINQEPNLFATSIMENIRYGRPDATDAEVFQAAKDANATEFISRFPDKYDTIVGERGATLSGGQKQRIAIARALLKDPQLLILDEATSALDTQSEKLVQQALDRLMEGRTVLVIAHRLSTIQHADKIVVMDGKGIDSNVIESGSHEELMKHGGVYFKLYQQLS